MKKETLRGVLLLFICSGFWVMMLTLVASFLGFGFAQGQQVPYSSQGTVPTFGIQPQGNATQFGQSYMNNNAMLPNQSQVAYNSATQEVKIPFQLDTSRWLAFSVVIDNTVQTVTVLDPAEKSMAVYHVYLTGSDKGKIEWTSTRNISGDLKYDAYNAISPFPPEIRAIVEQKDQ